MQTTRPFRLQTTARQTAAASAPADAGAARTQRSPTPKTPGATFGQRASAAGATVLTVICLLGGVLTLAEYYSAGSPAGAVLALEPAGMGRAAV